ncbi:MAG: hypothetical protein H0T84_10265 [Tatlockia sp.]|nr:hypothetical protein [Tatlockia sp.]
MVTGNIRIKLRTDIGLKRFTILNQNPKALIKTKIYLIQAHLKKLENSLNQEITRLSGKLAEAK